ncbi:kinase-like domain-containing protein [Scenedesmus sp. NREL 46B-D3]|nr:kinase-like domain-containing protein [Scenedesmus sp. NREL 46B-D3]
MFRQGAVVALLIASLLAAATNVTITGAQGLDTVLDLDFVSAAVQLCPACSVTFHNITVANDRHGVGEPVDFVTGQPGSIIGSAAVLFVGANKLRLACTDAAAAAATFQEAPSSSEVQQAVVQDAAFQASDRAHGTPFPGSLLLADVSMAVPYETVEGWRAGLGGYTVVNHNTTRLCRSIVDAGCVAKSTPTACVMAAMDEAVAAPAGGQAAGGASNAAAVAGAVVAGVASSGYDEELGEAVEVDVEALRMFDRWGGRDVAVKTARNVLVCSSQEAKFGMVAKLADLGLSRVIKLHRTHRTTNTVGTLSHMPPELLRYGHCSTAVDIYAFGVMTVVLLALMVNVSWHEFFEHVVLRNLRPLLPAGMPADYSLLMQHCWASDPASRPNVDRFSFEDYGAGLTQEEAWFV